MMLLVETPKYKKLTFDEFLDSKGVSYVLDNGIVTCNEVELCPYYKELLDLFSGFVPLANGYTEPEVVPIERK